MAIRRDTVDPGYAGLLTPEMVQWYLESQKPIQLQAGVTQPIMQRLMQLSPDPPAGFDELPTRFNAPGWGPAMSVPSGPTSELEGGEGTDTLAGGTRTLGGTAADRGLSRVDPRLIQIIDAAAARSPYDVQIFSGIRSGSVGGSRHNSGNAIDIALIDPTTGQVIPNYKSSTGFPIYAEFARIAREEQMQIAPDMADAFRWGGGFSDKDFDLMHFDFKPGGAMRYWTWEDGGKLTEAGAEAVPKFGPGWVYANGEKYRAPEGQYASLWGREPLQAPQDAQTAIASLIAPSGGPSVPDQPTAAMGYAPNIPLDASFAPALPPIQTAAAQPPPLPSPPPSWASAGGFPIDESLTGASAQDVLAGGPRIDPRRAGPATGPIAPDMGSILSPEDVLNAGPNLRPTGPGIAQRNAVSGAPDAALVPNPLSRLASGVTPPPPQVAAMPNPPMRPGGAPDAGMVPTPPSRASGLPDPRMRPDINDPSLSFNAPPYAGGGPTAGPVPPPMQSMVAGRPESPGALPPSPSQPQAPSPPITRETMDSLGLAQDLNADRMWQEWQTGALRPQASPPPAPLGRAPEIGNLNYSGPMPSALQPQTQAAITEPGMGLGPYGMSQPPSPFTSMVAGRPGFPGGGMPAAQGPFFDSANPGPTFSPPPPAGTAFDIPKSPFEGSTGEFFTPGPPMPSAPPAMSQGMRDQFDVAFSPGGGGQIMDLQSAFNRQNAPPTMTAQDGINSIFGAPPAAAQPPNLAIPFAEVPGFDFSGRFNGETPPAAAPPSPSSLFGPAPASAVTVASPLPSPIMPPSITQADFDARFGGGSVIAPPSPPTPGVTPGVVSGTMPQPMDIRPPVQSGPALTPPAAPPEAPRNIGPAAEREKKGLAASILSAVFGGSSIFGGGGGGMFGGSGNAFTPFSGGPMMNTGMGSFRSSGTAPNASGGQTSFQHGTAFNGSSPATTFTTSDGRTYTYTSDPITGAPIGGFV